MAPAQSAPISQHPAPAITLACFYSAAVQSTGHNDMLLLHVRFNTRDKLHVGSRVARGAARNSGYPHAVVSVSQPTCTRGLIESVTKRKAWRFNPASHSPAQRIVVNAGLQVVFVVRFQNLRSRGFLARGAKSSRLVWQTASKLRPQPQWQMAPAMAMGKLRYTADMEQRPTKGCQESTRTTDFAWRKTRVQKRTHIFWHARIVVVACTCTTKA